MKKILYKNRYRKYNGKLLDFNTLPNNIKQDLINIKKLLSIKDVFIYGSLNYGYYDEYSDYDLITITDDIEKDLEFKYNDRNVGLIKIPKNNKSYLFYDMVIDNEKIMKKTYIIEPNEKTFLERFGLILIP